MTIAADLQKLEHSATIELFVIDVRPLGGEIFRFHNGTNQLQQQLVWQGETYPMFPIEATGFDRAGDGPMPRPKVRVSNINGLVGQINREFSNLRGAIFIRKKTLARYLDAVNFPGGINPEANPSAAYPDETWLIDRKSHQDNVLCEYELASPFDVAGTKLPRRVVIADICTVGYRSAECGYTGGAVATEDDVPTSDPALDECGCRTESCKLRFGHDPDGLPFGGFPGCGKVRSI